MQNVKLFKSLSCSTNFDCFSLASCSGHSVSVLMMWRQSWERTRGWPLCRASQLKTWYTIEGLNWVPKECFQSRQTTTLCSSACTWAINSLYYGPKRKQRSCHSVTVGLRIIIYTLLYSYNYFRVKGRVKHFGKQACLTREDRYQEVVC